MSKVFFIVFIIFNSFTCFGEELKLVINNLPSNHMFSEAIYVAGDFNAWNPCDPNLKMNFNEDSTYSIVLKGAGIVNCKFTRGSWNTVEKGEDCTEVGNLSLTFGKEAIVYHRVSSWADLCGNVHTANENVSILSNDFFIPELKTTRRIWIYLPPNYSESAQHFPVLYMQDGQNLFDEFYSFSGEWGIDEALNRLFNGTQNGCIVVGIDNGGKNRINEYSPWINDEYGGGEGEQYASFLVNTLKPFIDKNFRTLPNRENTGIMGSSLGALISFYVGLKYHEVYSKIGVFSPSFWFSEECFTFAQQIENIEGLKLYFLGGGQESGVVANCNRMIDTLLLNGFAKDDIKMKVVEAGNHNETFWKTEFSEAFIWLYSMQK